DLFEQRQQEHPTRVLFQELADDGGGRWDYARTWRRVRAIAALMWRDGPRPALERGADRTADGPRVALWTDNGITSACCDLACLTHDLFVTPLNVHFGVGDLVWIFDRLRVTVAVCDTPERLDRLLEIRSAARQPFLIYALHPCDRVGTADVRLLDEDLADLQRGEIDAILADRPRRTLREPTTVMFTSGSTGRPKGVVFNQFNLVTKRFARAAALPAVGRDEVMLCYLPLFHTFGRYLEMLGTIFWGGTYVFAGNPSVETLLSQFQQVRPTALISVPLRWMQISDHAIAAARESDAETSQTRLLREIVGDRLYWGLSAAGYLDPRVFRFFHRHGVALCSGFGMTEGTGGLTMTPPDDYVEDSVGVPLPGVKVRFGDQDELQIAGVYIARYLPEEAPGGCLRVDAPESDDFWLATGDVFRRTRGDHLEIVDRIKDIYKNNKGQTIAPRQIESLFDLVPGIRRTFLAGDGRSYNTLLIVPDESDEVLRSLTDAESRREYFEQIVTLANPGLAAYERVVNFTILDRDFSADHGELTAKGSYKRKVIERNFAEEIAALYRTNTRTLEVNCYQVTIPRWFFRDLGVLDDAIVATENGLRNREDGRTLRVGPGAEGRVRIGDLEYLLKGRRIDLGLVARQPLLWLGNSAVIDFSPCKAGWDTDLGPFGEQVFLPAAARRQYSGPPAAGRVDRHLVEIDDLVRRALFGDAQLARDSLAALNELLGRVGPNQGAVIRRRLEALAGHQAKSVRCRAYQMLVLDQPVADYNRYLPAFIESGKPFLDKESFEAIGRAAIEPRRLEALRQRLHAYRTQLQWPAEEKRRRVFEDLFHLLADFGRFHPEFYGPIREELISWQLHVQDPDLARAAARQMIALSDWLEQELQRDFDGIDPAAWKGKIVFQEGLSPTEIGRLKEVLIGTTFLRQSIMLAFEGEDLAVSDIAPGGIFVSRIISRYEDSRYRASVNTVTGKHFDLQLIIREDADTKLLTDTIYWYIALRGYPFGTPMLPTFGCSRPELGALSMAYVSDLTVWEKIREFSSVRGPGTQPPSRMRWHQLMVRAMSVVVRGWRNSERRIIPGLITPNNIIVPEPDYRRGAVQNNLTGWKPYTGPLSLIRPLWRNMYHHTISHYPWVKEYLEREWILEAFVEALGVTEARAFFAELREEMDARDEDEMGLGFGDVLRGFAARLGQEYYPPLSLRAAIHRYQEWEIANPEATPRARLEFLEELSRLYKLHSLPEIARFTLFRDTYFRQAPPEVHDVFDRLVERMFLHPQRRATRMVELSDLQALLTGEDDRTAFHRLVFPHRQRHEQMEVRSIGTPDREQVIVRSTITDRYGRGYTVGEPAGPAEVGLLYRIFLQAGYPRTLSRSDRYFVITDDTEQIVGGLVYRAGDDDQVLLDGIVVRDALAERGIAAAVVADFCTRMASRGYKSVRTHYFLRRFFEKHGFRRDVRVGGLVRFL
ncbi:AMP-binding protein, partial [bacterium]|nr:AMP-binding protein [bacterium]